MSDTAGNAGGGCGSRGRDGGEGDGGQVSKGGWTRNYLWGKLFYSVSWDITERERCDCFWTLCIM